MSVKGKLVRLAYREETLRPRLLPLIEATSSSSKLGSRGVVHRETQGLLKSLWDEIKEAHASAGKKQTRLEQILGDLEDKNWESRTKAKKDEPDNEFAEEDWEDSPEGEKLRAEMAYVHEALGHAERMEKFLKDLMYEVNRRHDFSSWL